MTYGLQTSQSLHRCHQFGIQCRALGIISANIICTAAIVQLEIADCKLRQVFFHVKGCIFGVETAKQYQAQSQRTDDCHCPLFVTPQIRPGHSGNGSAIPGAFAFLPTSGSGVAHPQSLDGRNPAGQSCRTQTGDCNRQPCKNCGSKENNGICGNHSITLLLPHQHRNQHHAQQPAQKKAQRNTDRTQTVCLTVNKLFDLLCGSSQRFQLAIKLDIGGNADLKNIINNQITGKKHQYHAQIHRKAFLGYGSAHLRRIGQIHTKFQLRQSGVRQNIFHNSLNIAVAMQDHLCGMQAENTVFFINSILTNHLICKFPAYPCHTGVDRFVALPETTEGKSGDGDLILCKILAPFQRYGFPNLMRYPQAVKGQCVQGNLVCCLWHCSGGGHSKGMLCVDITAPTDLDLSAAQLFVLCKAKNKAFSGFCNIRMVGDQRKLFCGDVLKRCLTIITGLPEGHFHHIFIHTLCQGKQSSEHDRGHQDGDDRHQIPAFILLKSTLI